MYSYLSGLSCLTTCESFSSHVVVKFYRDLYIIPGIIAAGVISGDWTEDF